MMYNKQMDPRSKILIKFYFTLIFASVVLVFYKYLVLKDFDVTNI